MEYAPFKKFNKNELNKFNLNNNNQKKKCIEKIETAHNKQICTYKKALNNKKCNNKKKIVNYILNNNNDSCKSIFNDRIYPEITNCKTINQLFPRITKTNPNIFKGMVNQTLENIILANEETSQKKSTNTEHINQIMPLNINVENFIFNKNYDHDLSRKSQSSRKYNKKHLLE